jgi:hypothetical protein
MRNANKLFPIRGRGLSRGSGLHTVRVKVLRANVRRDGAACFGGMLRCGCANEGGAER